MGRVLVIGLDGATFDVIRPLVEAGRLPCLAQLMRNGVSGNLKSTLPPLTAPAWSSFITGVNPGRHSLVDFIRRQPGSYEVAPISAADRQAESLWSMVGRQGKRVVVVNVPATYPPEAVNGVMVTGMLTPPSASNFTYPPDLSAELHRLSGGRYPTDIGWAYSKGNLNRFVERLYRATQAQVNVVKHLLQHEPWDLFVYVFTGTDRMQHGLWHCMDPAHPFYPHGRNSHRDSIAGFYEYADQRLAEFLELAGDDVNVVVISDHGFGPFHKFIHVNNWLMEWGYLRLKQTAAARLKQALFKRGLTLLSAYNLILSLGLGGLKGAVSKGRNRRWLRRFFLSFDDVDWPQTRAYSLGTTGQVYLNLRGREPQGAVAPGAEYDQLREEIAARLAGMRDPATGESIVERVHRREEVYHGPYLDQMPDLIFVPRGFLYNGFGEYEFGSAALVDVSHGITGWHRMEGVLIMAGDDVRAGGLTVEGARLEDVAPTLLRLMGLGAPPGLDGRVLSDALPAEIGRVATITPLQAPAITGVGLSDAETAEVVERLRDLGYLG